MSESLPTSTKGKETWKSSMDLLPPSLSSSRCTLYDELQCSICLNAFTDPVSTPCGHTFCKSCLNECWNASQTCSCPNCRETFIQRPDLKINTTLKEISEHYKEKREKPEIPCDICDGKKVKALKSCLVCESSYCQTHLEPHLRVAGLKKHTLIDPVINLEDHICQKHNRPLELFCKDDQTCVCLFCKETEHKYHNTVPIEEESEEKKTQLRKKYKDTNQMIQDREKKIQDVKHSAEVRKKNSEKEKAARVDLFTDMIRSIESRQNELLQMMEEQQKEEEKEEEELIKKLHQEITELKIRNAELEQLSQTEDQIYLQKIYSYLCRPTNTRNWPDISVKTHDSLETLRRAFNQLKETIDKKLNQTVFTELKWMQQYAVDVTLDPDTAHPILILSGDRKEVRHDDIRQKHKDKSQKFDRYVNVRGKEGFSSGRFYFEVQVKGKTHWNLGVARESVELKGEIALSPRNGFWTVGFKNEDDFQACGGPSFPLCLKVKPQRVGVFVDYEEGLVSFYDVESIYHICSYTSQSFSDKLYPFFSPHLKHGDKNSTPLIITPVKYIK